jgi:hypothetical protein
METITVTVKPIPTAEHPLRALLRTSDGCARAVFNDPEHAALWADHPGHAPAMVDAYRQWTAYRQWCPVCGQPAGGTHAGPCAAYGGGHGA